MAQEESRARKALARLRRAAEKASRELDEAASAGRAIDEEGFPAEELEEARTGLAAVRAFVEAEEGRLSSRVLREGGIDPRRLA